jgi:hypothetical protein
VVFVGEVGSKKVYAIDYSPLNQSENIMKLLFGLDVQAEIRVRLLNAGERLHFNSEINSWNVGLYADTCNIFTTNIR